MSETNKTVEVRDGEQELQTAITRFKSLIQQIPDTGLKARKLESLDEIMRGDGVRYAQNLLLFGELDEELIPANQLRVRGIEPSRYKLWINSLLPCDRSVAHKLIENLRYIPLTELQQKLNDHWRRILAMSDGHNIVWHGAGRTFRPGTYNLDAKSFIPPSSFLVTKLIRDFLIGQGFRDYDAREDPFWNTVDEPIKRAHEKDQVALEISYPLHSHMTSHTIVCPLYAEDMREYFASKHPTPAYLMENQDGQRIALIADGSLVQMNAIDLFLWRKNYLDKTSSRVGVAVVGDDWSLGGTHQSNASQYLPRSLENIRQEIIDPRTKLALSYFFVSSAASDRIGQVLQTFKDQASVPNGIVPLYRDDIRLPVVFH